MRTLRVKTMAGHLLGTSALVLTIGSFVVTDRLPAATSSYALTPLAAMSGPVLYPHIDDRQNRTCENCHYLTGSNPVLLPDWAMQPPVDIDDTMFNNLCRGCHNDIVAPRARTHSSLATDEGYGTWTLECRTCHNPHQQEQSFVFGDAAHLVEGTVLAVTANSLTAVSGGWTDNEYRGLVLVPNIAEQYFAYKIERNSANTLYVSSPMKTDAVAPGNTFAVIYGKLARGAIATPASGTKTVRLFRASGTNSLADGDSTYDGVCEVCHTQTACFCNSTPGNAHRAGERCTRCHTHATGFKGAAGGAHLRHLPLLSCESGSQGCHGTSQPPLLSDGQGIAATAVCNNCHSPGGTYDGVGDPVIGAKANWDNGVYEGGDLAAGKEKWCATCHDEGSSVVGGVTAPNVVGDEDGSYGYGIGWGYYKTGHGLAGGIYTASQEPAANLKCTACHDPDAPHIDNNYRTYSASGDNYQAGYRLKRPMDIPRTDQGEPASDFQLCLDCHVPTSRFLVSTDTTTNFRDNTSANSHWMHLQAPASGMWAGGGWWDSDWNGTGDSKISCPACHNVHGSPSPRMLRHGELISTPGTTDKVPSINFRYTPYLPTPYPTLAGSTGGQLNPTSPGGGTVANTGICSMCHANTLSYVRTPTDSPPGIKGVHGATGSNVLAVVFTEGVYTNSGAAGALVAGDFTYTDADNGRTVTGATHSAGAETAYLTLSSALDSVNDIGVDALAAATTASIYDSASQPMGTTPVIVSGDAAQPSVADRSPANGATDVAIQSNVTLSLVDGESGVNWTTFSITLSGNMGYSATYTDLDTSVVSRTGSPAAYAVTVNPVANFSYGETITVTVNAADLVGNAMIPSVWSFTTVSGGAPLTLTLHPTDNVYSGIFSPVPTGSTWATVLAANDGDGAIVQSGTGSGYPLNTASRFIVNMEDPSGIEGATIQEFTVHVLARYVVAGGSPSPTTGVMQVCYTTNAIDNVCTGDITLPAVATYGDYATVTATTDSAGGALDLTDINNLRVEVRRRTSGGVWLRVTEVNAVVSYLP